MPRKGRDLERLVQVLEQSGFHSEGVAIQSPGYVEDAKTHTKREFDLLAHKKVAHHELLLAFECRDRKVPVGVHDVEGFATKCSDCHIDHKIIVSSSGFSDPAKTKADAYGIHCFSIEECSALQSILLDHIHSLHTLLKSSYWYFDPAEKLPAKPANFAIEVADARELTTKNLEAWLFEVHRQQQEWPRTGQFTAELPGEGLFIRNRDTGSRHAVRKGAVEVDIETISSQIPVKFSTYSNAGTGQMIKEIATADLKSGPVQGKIVIAHNFKTGGGVYFVPAPSNSNGTEKQ